MQARTQQIPAEKSSVSLAAIPSQSVPGQGILTGTFMTSRPAPMMHRQVPLETSLHSLSRLAAWS